MESFWVALALIENEKELLIASCGPTKAYVTKNATKRIEKGTPLFCLDIMNSSAPNLLCMWLAEYDILGAENAILIRKVGASVDEMLAKFNEENLQKLRTPTKPQKRKPKK